MQDLDAPALALTSGVCGTILQGLQRDLSVCVCAVRPDQLAPAAAIGRTLIY